MPISVGKVSGCEGEISLIAPPLYVMTTMALQEREGVELLSKAIGELERVLKENGGAMSVKNEVSVESVSEA